ncbi:hypothetical protein OROMI_033968 [Orobanche minor]
MKFLGEEEQFLAVATSVEQPPRTWIKAQLESRELLTFCVKRLKNLNKVRFLKMYPPFNKKETRNPEFEETMTWFSKKLGAVNPTLKSNVGDFCATFSSDQEETCTPITQTHKLQEAPLLSFIVYYYFCALVRFCLLA